MTLLPPSLPRYYHHRRHDIIDVVVTVSNAMTNIARESTATDRERTTTREALRGFLKRKAVLYIARADSGLRLVAVSLAGALVQF